MAATSNVIELLSLEDLRPYGIKFHRSYLNRLMKAGQFPQAYRFANGGRLHWRKADIEQFVRDQLLPAESAKAPGTSERRFPRDEQGRVQGAKCEAAPSIPAE